MSRRLMQLQGHVGWPLSNVELRLWDSEGNRAVEEEDLQGDVEVSGPGIFTE